MTAEHPLVSFQIILVKAEGFFVYPAVCQEETAGETAHFPALKATVERCL